MKYKIIPVTHYQQNCSLIICEETNKAALIDPGGDLEKITAVISRESVELEKILLTHGHFDHVGGAEEAAKKFDVPIIGPSEEDKFWLGRLPYDGRATGFGTLKAFTPTRWLVDGESINVGNICLKVVHCPGHTPGHVAFIDEKNRIAFVGDILFKDSIGRTDFPRSDHDALIKGIKEKLLVFGDDIMFIPGHGSTSTFGREREHNPFIQ